MQKYVRDLYLKHYRELTPNDIKSTSMGASGIDVQLSEFARELIPFDTECKSRASIAVYQMFQQATDNSGEGRIPLLVIKQNHSEPLAVLRMEDLMRIQAK